jgi:hypothetical protein
MLEASDSDNCIYHEWWLERHVEEEGLMQVFVGRTTENLNNIIIVEKEVK